jgi:hypothetical protein
MTVISILTYYFWVFLKHNEKHKAWPENIRQFWMWLTPLLRHQWIWCAVIFE